MKGFNAGALLLLAASCLSGCVESGSFTDERDGQVYDIITLRGQTWMARNLNYATLGGSTCAGDYESNCEKYGFLYTWDTAMTACPDGWRLPSRDDWDLLMQHADGRKSDNYGKYHDWSRAGEKLKAKTGWKKTSWGSDGNGMDRYGFCALPGGGGYSTVGKGGNWWSSTESYGTAYSRFMVSDSEGVGEDDNSGKSTGLSVRCIKD